MTPVVLVVLGSIGVVLLAGPVALQAFATSRARQATLLTEAASAVPGGGWPLAGRFQELGFTPVTTMRIVAPSVPDQSCLLLAAPSLATFARLWVGPDGQVGTYSLQSPLPFGTLVTAVDVVDTASRHELLQTFPGAEPGSLLDHHREAQRFLARLGVDPLPVRAADADARFRAEWAEELEALARRGITFSVGMAYRSALKLPKFKGPLDQQRGIEDRVRRLATDPG